MIDLLLALVDQTFGGTNLYIPTILMMLAIGIICFTNKNWLQMPRYLIESYTERTFQEKGFILGRISRLIFDNYFEEGEFQKLIRESVEQMKNESKINDVIVVFKTIKSGIQESLMLYDREDKLVSYKNISNTAINLKLQREFVLPFYIYINAEQIDKIDYKGVRRDIGKKIGHNMMDFFEKSLKQWISVLQAREDALCAQ